MAEATKPAAPDHLVVPLGVCACNPGLLDAAAPAATGNLASVGGGGEPSSNFILDVAIAPTILGPPAKVPATSGTLTTPGHQ